MPLPTFSSANSTAAPIIDVAVNIFAKPYQTSLSLLSLLRASGQHIRTIYLQFEPYGSEHDRVSPYLIATYLHECIGAERCCVFQPEYWLDLNAVDLARMDDPTYRYGVRYQYAFEHSTASLLFLMHNDVLIQRDILGAMLDARGEAFAIGPLGQCWNCPASKPELMKELFDCPACGPTCYDRFKPSFAQLTTLYTRAHEKNIFVRPYDEAFVGIFDTCPWPLPECRINEWACLIDLEQTRALTMPFGTALPPGAYRQCGPVCLDIGVEWFRAMHTHGLHAQHFATSRYMQHWVGTGKVTPRKYILAEENALGLLKKHFPDYITWLQGKSGQIL